MSARELEFLLSEKEKNNFNILNKPSEKKIERLTSEKSATIDDFIVMLSTLITKALKKQHVEFKPDEGIRLQVDQVEELKHPYIFFKIVSCSPTMEITPRVREVGLRENFTSSPNNKISQRFKDEYGQWFDYKIQFDVLAPGYEQAQRTMIDLEDIIFTYTDHFMKNGVKKILFSGRFTDRNLDQYRQKCSVRSLRYNVKIDKTFNRYHTEIENIAVR